MRMGQVVRRSGGQAFRRTGRPRDLWVHSRKDLQHIRQAAALGVLRAKVDRQFSTELIMTVRGAGYMLEDPEAKR